jgi:uncharacterized protein YndB with AHSA1/START domain
MTSNHIAIATTTINAPADAVWNALTDPALIKEYEDHGRILDLKPGELLRSTHFSPLGGKQDIPENYHTLTWTLEPDGDSTTLTLTQDNNETEDAAKHSEDNWTTVLTGLKELVESQE